MAKRLEVSILLAAVFVVAFVGTFAAMVVMGMLSRAPNWPAIEAIGTLVAAAVTLAAVGVALVPIFVDARRRRAVASTVRSRIVVHVATLAACFDDPLKSLSSDATDYDYVPLPQDPAPHIAAMDTLAAEAAKVLEPEEVESINDALFSVRLAHMRHDGRWNLGNVRKVAASMNTAAEALSRARRRERSLPSTTM